jgi:hypothetical protein
MYERYVYNVIYVCNICMYVCMYVMLSTCLWKGNGKVVTVLNLASSNEDVLGVEV